MVSLKQNERLGQPGFSLAQTGAAPPYRRHSLAQAQIEPLDHCRVDLPATSRQGPIHRRFRTEYDPMFDLDDTPALHRLNHLGIE